MTPAWEPISRALRGSLSCPQEPFMLRLDISSNPCHLPIHPPPSAKISVAAQGALHGCNYHLTTG